MVSVKISLSLILCTIAKIALETYSVYTRPIVISITNTIRNNCVAFDSRLLGIHPTIKGFSAFDLEVRSAMLLLIARTAILSLGFPSMVRCDGELGINILTQQRSSSLVTQALSRRPSLTRISDTEPASHAT